MAGFPPDLSVRLHQSGRALQTARIRHDHDVIAVLGGVHERFLGGDRCDPNRRKRLLKWPRHGMHVLEVPEAALMRHARSSRPHSSVQLAAISTRSQRTVLRGGDETAANLQASSLRSLWRPASAWSLIVGGAISCGITMLAGQGVVLTVQMLFPYVNSLEHTALVAQFYNGVPPLPKLITSFEGEPRTLAKWRFTFGLLGPGRPGWVGPVGKEHAPEGLAEFLLSHFMELQQRIIGRQ